MEGAGSAGNAWPGLLHACINVLNNSCNPVTTAGEQKVCNDKPCTLDCAAEATSALRDFELSIHTPCRDLTDQTKCDRSIAASWPVKIGAFI